MGLKVKREKCMGNVGAKPVRPQAASGLERLVRGQPIFEPKKGRRGEMYPSTRPSSELRPSVSPLILFRILLLDWCKDAPHRQKFCQFDNSFPEGHASLSEVLDFISLPPNGALSLFGASAASYKSGVQRIAGLNCASPQRSQGRRRRLS